MAEQELHQVLLARQLHTRAVVVEAEIAEQSIRQAVLAVMAVAGQAEELQLLELQILAEAVEAVLSMVLLIMARLAVLVLSFCLYQQSTIQAQPQAHRQSRQAVHTQF
jgi:hypothetical protein